MKGTLKGTLKGEQLQFGLNFKENFISVLIPIFISFCGTFFFASSDIGEIKGIDYMHKICINIHLF